MMWLCWQQLGLKSAGLGAGGGGPSPTAGSWQNGTERWKLVGKAYKRRGDTRNWLSLFLTPDHIYPDTGVQAGSAGTAAVRSGQRSGRCKSSSNSRWERRAGPRPPRSWVPRLSTTDTLRWATLCCPGRYRTSRNVPGLHLLEVCSNLLPCCRNNNTKALLQTSPTPSRDKSTTAESYWSKQVEL